ncbi:MAG: outer membrane lipoprotein-sorting protein [Myxococcota bacterium]|nr:outer membrane lipoprotein-sorting protein [Myxococcota bacterium]
MRSCSFALLLLALLFPLAASAADPDPAFDGLVQKGAQSLLEEADKRHNDFKDQTIQVKMVLHGGANDGNEYQFVTITKGDNMRALRFEAPADMKGMGIVIKGRDEIYVRLPDTDKVRRVGSHARRQSFNGSDWNMDEMSMIRLAKDYTATIESQTDSHVVMSLVRNEGVDLIYPKLTIYLDKSKILIDKLEYFDDDGKMVKRQERFDCKKVGGTAEIYTRITMTDLSTDHMTENLVLDEKVDENVADDTFSKRWLVRGL